MSTYRMEKASGVPVRLSQQLPMASVCPRIEGGAHGESAGLTESGFPQWSWPMPCNTCGSLQFLMAQQAPFLNTGIACTSSTNFLSRYFSYLANCCNGLTVMPLCLYNYSTGTLNGHAPLMTPMRTSSIHLISNHGQ